MTTWTPYGRQIAAEAELLQQICSRNLQKNAKRRIPCSTRRKRETVIENETYPFEATVKKEAKCEASDATKSGKSVVLYAKSVCTPFVTYANSMQDKLAQDAQSVKHQSKTHRPGISQEAAKEARWGSRGAKNVNHSSKT